KRMSFLGRGEGISAEKFQQEWWETHSEMVKKIPGYLGYAQNLVIDRIVNGKHVSYEELPIEGMVEFWFEDMEGFNQCYSSEEFMKTAAHGKTFLGSVTTYLMETAVYPVPGEE
ncbi:MAG: EthD family reductase, partial [Oscillospiraceae bacterium]|nr:EthD family reductase [Oscillospiraceae bacterium]